MYWEKPYETVPVDITGKKRPYYYSLRVLRTDLGSYLDYEESGELVVSFVVALRENYQEWPELVDTPELMLKKVFWSVKNLCEATDLVEKGVGIRLSISDDLRDLAMPYIEACRFPMSHVIWFDSQESIDNICVCKYEAILNAIHGFNRALHMDLTVQFMMKNSSRAPFFSILLEEWDSQPFAAWEFREQIDPVMPSLLRKKLRENSRVAARVARLTGSSIEDELSYWDRPVHLHIVPLAFGAHRKIVETGKVHDMLNLTPIVADDERTLPVFMRIHNFMENDGVDIRRAIERVLHYSWFYFLSKDFNLDYAQHLIEWH